MKGFGATNVHEQLWVDTLVKRFRDRQNLFMYTIANEFERYPDGQYRYDSSDVDWARRVAARIRKLDAVHHIGCHPSVWITDQDAPARVQDLSPATRRLPSAGPRSFGPCGKAAK